MLFNSFSFLILVVSLFAIYYIPVFKKKQVALLIIASLFFYGYSQPYLLILLVISASLNVYASYMVYYSKRKMIYYAILGVLLNLFVLAFFKYNKLIFSSFINDTESNLSFLLLLPLPVGISFYTFQGISLVLDVFFSRKNGQVLEFDIPKKYTTYWYNALFYITFFPQLVAGPIEKAHHFMPQIKEKKISDIDWNNTLKMLIIGYFLKMVVADNLKDFTGWIEYPVFTGLSSITLAFLLIGYSAQIFADFAGYSAIAIGIAGLFGYRLMINFNYPYISKSFSEFWRRWHISLSTWLREYLYIPLGGNRKSKYRTYLNLLVVMSLGGLWHGALLSYAVWGLWHGIMLCVERPFLRKLEKLENRFISFTRIIFVFLLVTLSWLLFKLPNFNEVIEYFIAFVNNFSKPIGRTDYEIIMPVFIYSTLIFLYHSWYILKSKKYLKFKIIEPISLGILLFFILINRGTPGAFIYFQF